MLLLNPGRFGFDPASLSGITSRWPFQDESAVMETGGNVEKITDPINAYEVSQSVPGDRPTYNSAGAGINGLRTAEHTDAGNEHLDEGGPTVLQLLDPSGTDGYTIVVGCDYKKIAPDATIVTFFGDQFAIVEITNDFRFRIAGVDKCFVTSTTGKKLFIATYDGQLTGGTCNLRINGVDTLDTANRGGTDTGTFEIGDSGFTQDMEMAEIFTYDRELTLAEKIQVEGYFTGFWGFP